MKKVILGCAYILGGILLSVFALFQIEANASSGIGPVSLIIGITLFLVGSILGFAGISDNK